MNKDVLQIHLLVKTYIHQLLVNIIIIGDQGGYQNMTQTPPPGGVWVILTTHHIKWPLALLYEKHLNDNEVEGKRVQREDDQESDW